MSRWVCHRQFMICCSALSTRARPESGLNGVRSLWEVTSLTLAGRSLGGWRLEGGGPVCVRQQPLASPDGQAPQAASRELNCLCPSVPLSLAGKVAPGLCLCQPAEPYNSSQPTLSPASGHTHVDRSPFSFVLRGQEAGPGGSSSFLEFC